MSNPLSHLLNKAFLVRTAEQLALTFSTTFVGALSLGPDGLGTSALAAAAAAGLRAVYAVIVQNKGVINTPSVK